jgi:hypothetical protein
MILCIAFNADIILTTGRRGTLASVQGFKGSGVQGCGFRSSGVLVQRLGFGFCGPVSKVQESTFWNLRRTLEPSNT